MVRQHTTAGLASSEPCRESRAEEQQYTLRLQPSLKIVSFVEMQEAVKAESYDELDVVELVGGTCSGDDVMDDLRKLGPPQHARLF